MIKSSARTLPLKSPRTSALAFRIYIHARERGWNTTVLEIAEDLDIAPTTVSGICNYMRWNYRLGGTAEGLGNHRHEPKHAFNPKMLAGEIPSVFALDRLVA